MTGAHGPSRRRRGRWAVVTSTGVAMGLLPSSTTAVGADTIVQRCTVIQRDGVGESTCTTSHDPADAAPAIEAMCQSDVVAAVFGGGDPHQCVATLGGLAGVP